MCAGHPHLLHFSSIPRLTESLLAKPEETAAIREGIERDQTALAEATWEAAEDGLAFRHGYSEFDIRESSIADLDFVEVNVVALGDRECTLIFDATVKFVHTLEWWVDEGPPYEGYTASGEVTSEDGIAGTAKAKLGPDSRTVEEITFLELHDHEIVVLETPRHGW